MTVELVELTEYTPTQFERNVIPESIGETLWCKYPSQVAVDFPSPKTDHKWQLTSQGWVGYIPLTPEFQLVLNPKVDIDNLFRMLEYAYRLDSFRFLDGLVDCHSIRDFYERLANILARKVVDRGRKGYYRTYEAETDKLPYVRGRLNVRHLMQVPWDVNLHCHYHEHTADIEDNKLLAWTLFCIARSGMCTDRVLPTVRKAYRGLQGLVSLKPFRPNDCIGRLYNRLNQDYEPLHALCRFFLEYSGPSHETGDRSMIPFLVDMAKLYELFVAEWLKLNLPSGFKVKPQERVYISNGEFHFDIDLVLHEVTTGKAVCVLDTKYKAPEKPAMDDIAQVVAYAVSKGCNEAILVYPTTLAKPIDTYIGEVHIRSLTFSTDSNIDKAGEVFMEDMFKFIENNTEVQYVNI